MKYKAAIFDLDGTLLNTIEDLADAVNYALKSYGYPEHTVDKVKSYVGNGIRKLIERAVPEGTPSEITDKVHKAFTEYYRLHCADKTKPYDDIIKVIKILKSNKVKVAVLSNKADYAVKMLCDTFFEGMFDYVAGEKTGIPRKPQPEGVYAVLGYIGVDAKDAVYIGDSEVDYNTALNSGTGIIMAAWGFRGEENLRKSGVANIISTPLEIVEKME